MKSSFKSRLLRSTQKEIKKIKDASSTGKNISYPEFIKDNILELLNDGFRSVDLLSKDLGLSKTLIYGVRKNGDFKKEKAIDNTPAKSRKNSKENKKNKKVNNNNVKKNDNIFDFLDLSSSLDGNVHQEPSACKIPKSGMCDSGSLQENQSKNIENIYNETEKMATNDKIKPFMKVSSPSGFTIEIWG